MKASEKKKNQFFWKKKYSLPNYSFDRNYEITKLQENLELNNKNLLLLFFLTFLLINLVKANVAKRRPQQVFFFFYLFY